MNRTITVVSVAVAALALSSTGAVAGSLVTSKQIKDGTIQKRDLASSTIQALKGARGPAGASGVAKFYQKSYQRTLADGDSLGWSAACNAGDLAVGGGMKPSGPGVLLQGSYPHAATAGNAWDLQVWNTSGTSRSVDFYAVCVDR